MIARSDFGYFNGGRPIHFVEIRGKNFGLDHRDYDNYSLHYPAKGFDRSAYNEWFKLEPFLRIPIPLSTNFDSYICVNWNGTAFYSFDSRRKIPGKFSWLAIAWICCEIDREEGQKFASSILSADPEDDVPALIACDWIESRGVTGKAIVRRTSPLLRGIPDDCFLGWTPSYSDFTEDLKLSGPIDSWCRNFIEHRCIRCGKAKGHKKSCRIYRANSNLKLIIPEVDKKQIDR